MSELSKIECYTCQQVEAACLCQTGYKANPYQEMSLLQSKLNKRTKALEKIVGSGEPEMYEIREIAREALK